MAIRNVLRVCLLLAAVGCGGASPGIQGHAVYTPDYYSENKVLFVDNGPGQHRQLRHAYELERDNAKNVQRLAPLGVIVRGVRLPDDLEGRRDVAVILDVVTASSSGSTSLLVFYQRDVPGGQMLNFQDLLVYYDPEWDGITPPWFRIRVMEVNAERNERTSGVLKAVSNLSGSIAGIVPHPVLPAVQTAMNAAELILTNRKNKVFIDYQVQFYSPAQIAGADAPLTPLRRGEWLVVGRARERGSDFWGAQLQVDIRTGHVHRADAGPTKAGPPAKPASGSGGAAAGGKRSTVEHVPYVSLVLMSADAGVPKHILDRSQALIALLSSPTERSNFEGMSAAVGALGSAVRAYADERRLRKYGSTQDFRNIVDRLKEHLAAAADGRELLRVEQVRTLVRLIDEMVAENVLFGGPKDVVKWWNQPHVSSGRLEKEEGAPLGWVWVWSTP